MHRRWRWKSPPTRPGVSQVFHIQVEALLDFFLIPGVLSLPQHLAQVRPESTGGTNTIRNFVSRLAALAPGLSYTVNP